MKLEYNSITTKSSHSLRLGQNYVKRDDFSFLEGRVFGATGQPFSGRLSKRLAGSQSEAQPPGARMAVREKTVTRCTARVKPYPTICGWFGSTTSARRNNALWQSAGRRPFLEMLVVPGEDAVQTVHQVFLFMEAVRLARVHDQFGFDAVALEAAVEFLALARRIDGVGVALKN